MNVAFFCRPSKAGNDGTAPIECSVTINGKRCIFNTERREKPADYKRLMKEKDNNDLKMYIDLLRSKLNKGLTEMMLLGEEITLSAIKNYVKYDGIQQYTIEDLVTRFLEHQQRKVMAGTQSESVYNKYVIIINYFIKHFNKYTELNTIKPADLEAFHLEMQKIYQKSTLAGQMFRLKSMFNYAMENDMIKTNPFKVKIQRATPKIEYLEEEEVNLLRNAKIENESLCRIIDLALFQIGSGLSYADLSKLAPESVKTNENGVAYIKDERQKTGIEYTAVLLPDALKVWNKYDGCLPTISNQKYNAYLKAVGDILGIKKTLHTHIFRKTYSTILLNEGVRMDVVAKAVGHTSTRITATTYAFMMKQTIINEIGDIVCGKTRTKRKKR